MTEAERIASSTPNDPLLNVPSRVYPLYDGHGNMVATLKKSGVNNFTLANEKRYEAWGRTRFDSGIAGSDHVVNPKTQYCANLGHSFDENSGLTYMRARWYDAGSGRFIGEDPAMDGHNWYIYCRANPIQLVDPDGRNPAASWFGGMFTCTMNLAAAVAAGDGMAVVFWIEILAFTELSAGASAAIMSSVAAAGAVKMRLTQGGLSQGQGLLDQICIHAQKINDVLAKNPNANVDSMIREMNTFMTQWIDKCKR